MVDGEADGCVLMMVPEVRSKVTVDIEANKLKLAKVVLFANMSPLFVNTSYTNGTTLAIILYHSTPLETVLPDCHTIPLK